MKATEEGCNCRRRRGWAFKLSFNLSFIRTRKDGDRECGGSPPDQSVDCGNDTPQPSSWTLLVLLLLLGIGFFTLVGAVVYGPPWGRPASAWDFLVPVGGAIVSASMAGLLGLIPDRTRVQVLIFLVVVFLAPAIAYSIPSLGLPQSYQEPFQRWYLMYLSLGIVWFSLLFTLALKRWRAGRIGS